MKTKAVEYVRGRLPEVPDSTTIPGTDICIKLGVYLHADLVISSNSEFADDFAAKSADNGARSFEPGREPESRTQRD